MTDRGAMGESKSRLYNIWRHMRARCGNPRNAAFKHYGGRGIKVCTQWNDSYLAFRAWALENGYSETLTIDRKDNDAGYDPSNCRWATYAQQNRNYRRNRPVFYKGQEWLGSDVTPHVLRHTCASWLLWGRPAKGARPATPPLTVWDVAGIIGADASTIDRVYGHHRNIEPERKRA